MFEVGRVQGHGLDFDEDLIGRDGWLGDFGDFAARAAGFVTGEVQHSAWKRTVCDESLHGIISQRQGWCSVGTVEPEISRIREREGRELL